MMRENFGKNVQKKNLHDFYIFGGVKRKIITLMAESSVLL